MARFEPFSLALTHRNHWHKSNRNIHKIIDAVFADGDFLFPIRIPEGEPQQIETQNAINSEPNEIPKVKPASKRRIENNANQGVDEKQKRDDKQQASNKYWRLLYPQNEVVAFNFILFHF